MPDRTEQAIAATAHAIRPAMILRPSGLSHAVKNAGRADGSSPSTVSTVKRNTCGVR